MQKRWIAGAIALVLLGASGVAMAKHKARPQTPANAEPTQNFVTFGMTAPAPRPMEGGENARIQLLDSLSIKRDGDDLRFDVLEIRPPDTGIIATRKSILPSNLPHGLRSQIYHFQANCGWRTIDMLHTDTLGGDFRTLYWTAGETRILRLSEEYEFLLDRLCVPGPLNAAQGAPSANAAIALWKDMFTLPPELVAFAVPLNPADEPNAVRLPSTPGGADMRMIYKDNATGNTLFFDTTKLARTGDTVTSLSVEFLGPAFHDPEKHWRAVGVSRKVAYDCAARTMTVQGEIYVNADGIFFDAINLPGGPRAANTSPVAAAEIAAACDGPPPGAPVYTSMKDAWRSVVTPVSTPAP